MTRLRLGGAWDMRGGRRRRRGPNPRRVSGTAKYTRGMLVSGWSAIGVTAVLVIGTLVGYVKYRDILDGIKHIDVTDLGKRPPKLNNAMNILLIGSDSRSGRNGKIGGRVAQGQRSDTVMIVHISPGHRHIYVLSFPRDTVVPIYPCAPEPGFNGQTAQPGAIEQLNATFAYGGPGCLWKTLEHTTSIRIDDFIELNFTGFISVINALGGVEVCLPTAIHPSSYDHLSLSAGRHFLYGYKALEFWRLREDFGLGSDLQRIQRDQLLMVALVQRILRSGVLHSLTRTYSIMSAIVRAHALTTDTGLTPNKILQIGSSLSGISRKSVQFVEVPTVTYPPNPNWVEWDTTQDPKLFSAVAHDVKLPKVHKGKQAKGGTGKHSGGNGSTAPKLLTASKVNVEVLNGSGVSGIAGATGTALTARGFHVLGAVSALTSTGAPDFSYVQSVVEYGSTADLAAARTVAAQLQDVTLQLNTAVPAGQVNLILGSTFKALAPQKSQSQSPGNLAKQYSGYTGSTNVCRGYGTAFAGA
jgi:LCP family protein required for cell wall assembly